MRLMQAEQAACPPCRWFGGGEALDNELRDKFGGDLADMAAGKLDGWLEWVA